MGTPYKIISHSDPSENSVVLMLDGKFSEDALPELARLVHDARRADRHVVLDLSEVTLVDRKAVQYLSEQTSLHVKLVNCPPYLRNWISQLSEPHES
jgi:anti-anti-sigma regulatory factor